MNTKIATTKEYINSLPVKLRPAFKEFHNIIKNAAPNAEEGISYGMPCLKMKGILLYYASHTAHFSLYPLSKTIEIFKDDLVGYKTSKGTIQFPHGKPIPNKLITAITKYRVKELLEMETKKAILKNKKK